MFQPLDKIIAIDVHSVQAQTDWKKVPGVNSVYVMGWQFDFVDIG
jgi:hypothetical protein